jgi:hypothetical protein
MEGLLIMNVYCAECGDRFTPIEGTELPVGVEELQFCSDTCGDANLSREEASEVYDTAADPAPVFSA